MKRMTLPVYKAVWRDQVFNDHELPCSVLKLAYFLADYLTMTDSAAKYRRHGKAIVWPSQAELATRTQLDLSTISVGVRRLIEHGHMRRIRRGNQVKGSNKYRLLVKEASVST